MTRLKIYRGDKTSLDKKPAEDGAIYIAPNEDGTFSFAADVLKDGETEAQRYELKNNLSDDYITGTVKSKLGLKAEIAKDDHGNNTEELIINL